MEFADLRKVFYLTFVLSVLEEETSLVQVPPSSQHLWSAFSLSCDSVEIITSICTESGTEHVTELSDGYQVITQIYKS